MPRMLRRSLAGLWLIVGLTTIMCQTSADEMETFTGSQAGEERLITLTPALSQGEREKAGIKVCWCPPGKFLMGSPENEPDRRPDEGPIEVRLTKGFWIGKYEVTQAQWKRIVGDFPRELKTGVGDDFPMHSINYAEALGFCQKATERGREAGEVPRGWAFQLPTEAQWEYACRAGTTTATAFGERLTSKQANFKSQPASGGEAGPSLDRATPVGSYPANRWGLADMHGNIFEWCRDWYHQKLPGGVDPDLSAKKGTINRDGTYSRARRGGAFTDEGKFCRSAMRLRYEPERTSDHIGFRVALVRE